MSATNAVAETEEQAVSPKKRITLSSDPDLFFHTEAATQISDQQEHTEGQRKRLEDDMFNAIHTGKLDGYDMRTGALLHLPFEKTKPVCVRVADVNDWLKREGSGYGWVAPIVHARDTADSAATESMLQPVVATCAIDAGQVAGDGSAKQPRNKTEKTLIFEARVMELMTQFWNNRTTGTKPTKGELCKQVYAEMLRGPIRGQRSFTDSMVRDAAKPWKRPLVLPSFVPDSKFNDKRHPFKREK